MGHSCHSNEFYFLVLHIGVVLVINTNMVDYKDVQNDNPWKDYVRSVALVWHYGITALYCHYLNIY